MQAHEKFGKQEFLIFIAAFGVFALGQTIQYFPDDFPRLLRHHLTNVVDPIVSASLINTFSMLKFKGRSRALPLALLFTGYGSWVEYQQYFDRVIEQGNDAEYDWLDQGIFISSAILYGLWGQARYKKRVLNGEAKESELSHAQNSIV